MKKHRKMHLKLETAAIVVTKAEGETVNAAGL